MYASAQFKILKRNIEVSGTNSISDSNESKKSLIISAAQAYDRLTECIKKHYLLIAYIDRIENIICYALLVQTLCTVLQICFISIQFLIVSPNVLIMLIDQVNFQRCNDDFCDFKGRQEFDRS